MHTLTRTSASRLSRPSTRLGCPAVCRPLRWRAVGLAALLGGLLVLAACQPSNRRDSGQEALSRAMATVNNEKITYEDFQNAYQLFLTRWDRFVDATPEKRQEVKEALLRQMIDEVLMDQEGRRRGIVITEEELKKESLALLDTVEENRNGAESPLSKEALAEWNRDLGRRLFRKKLIQTEVVDKIRITPAEMRRYYDRNLESFRRPERVKVRHIAVGSRSLYNRVSNLIQRNRDFISLVRTYSITPDRHADGDLGFVERGILPEEFDTAIFSMQRVGSIHAPSRNPVKTEMGYHIFRLEGREPEGIQPFRKAIPEIKQILLDEKQPEAYAVWLQGLRDRATIRINNDLISTE